MVKKPILNDNQIDDTEKDEKMMALKKIFQKCLQKLLA
jgi:hypothetical protein